VVGKVSRKLCIGIDPDLHSSGIAFVAEDTGELVGVAVLREIVKKKGREACVEAAVRIAGFQKLEYPFYPFIWETEWPDSIFAAAAVEGQEAVYAAKHGAGPRPLILLAHVSGAWLNALAPMTANLYLPAPAEWKGQVPKHIKQGRIAAKIGVEVDVVCPSSPYCVPKDPSKIPGGDKIKKAEWSEVFDAIGLALYAREQYMKEGKKNVRRG
jgi:hypothetical protein